MKNIYDWRGYSDKYYYYNTVTGKIVGLTSKIALQDIYYSVVYTGTETFTIADEKHLGQYISLEHAKKATEWYWEVEDKTLLAHDAYL